MALKDCAYTNLNTMRIFPPHVKVLVIGALPLNGWDFVVEPKFPQPQTLPIWMNFATFLFQHRTLNVATLALGSQPRQGLTRLWTKRESREWKKVWGNEPSHSQGSFHFGSWSLGGLPNVQRVIAGAKTQLIENLFIPLKIYWNLDV